MKTLHLLVLCVLLCGCWGCVSYNLPTGYSYVSFESGHYPTMFSYKDDAGNFHTSEYSPHKSIARELAWSHWYAMKNKKWQEDVVVPVPLPESPK